MKSRNLIGRTLANFQVERLVGRGGMAEVYHGIDIKLHRPVAIKVFDSAARAKPSQTNRFLQEARMMAKWRHENIIQIFYAGDDADLFYYVMEYIDGYDLASIMAVYAEKDELMPMDDVLRVGDSIASALDYAHSQGVIHRDVKPANVMVANKDGRVVLGDFGLALDLTEKSQGEVFGSPHYIAPEQARRSSDAVPQSDLYSLGVILYEMITGATPFNDPSPASLALQHIAEPPPPPRSINPSVPVKVEQVLLKALEKSPRNRYQSGKEMMDALRKAVKASPAIAQPDTPALPPIPVNAPTIRRSDVSLNSFTRRRDVITALEKRTNTSHEMVEPIESQAPRKRRFGWAFLLLLLMLACAGLATFRPDLLASARQLVGSQFTSAQSVEPTTEQTAEPLLSETVPPEATPTEVIIPTNTLTFTPTATLTATSTFTQIPIPSGTSTPTALPTVVAGTTTPNNIGHLMTAFYNENSFYMLDRGKASRSISGFVFERISDDGVIQERFAGWKWEKYFNAIQPNRCVSLVIFEDPEPYLQPMECENRVLSTLALLSESNELFWIPADNGKLFRILWLNNEIVRCEIDAGSCDFYVP